ncbi:hypothetical protein T492DRAFT_1100731 [Pavlovales sp. CCMP2436]|nr:hypothetical protein T492DRAFT_1100731 [Pavlovales sp. CCMP2436]
MNTAGLLDLRPKALIGHIQESFPQYGSLLDVPMQAKVISFRKGHLVKQRAKSGITSAQRNTFGISQFAELHMKDVVLGQPGFNEHTPYVFGKTVSKDIFFTMSTENQLLNAYRQASTSQAACWEVDTTYRLTTEGLATMPIGTVDPSQTYHHIAHGICLHEGTKDHVIALQNVKDEVEAVIARYAASGKRV